MTRTWCISAQSGGQTDIQSDSFILFLQGYMKNHIHVMFLLIMFIRSLLKIVLYLSIITIFAWLLLRLMLQPFIYFWKVHPYKWHIVYESKPVLAGTTVEKQSHFQQYRVLKLSLRPEHCVVLLAINFIVKQIC